MNQSLVIFRGRRIEVLAAGLASLIALVLSGCGGGASAVRGPGHQPRSSSVGNGDASAPPIAAEVIAAARAAGCTVRAFPSEGRGHVQGEPTYRQSMPPTSGPHNPVWADWGIYDKPVPARFQVHNLEHGGVILHEGKALTSEARGAVRSIWTADPAYLLIVPEDTPSFPADALVVTSWQRWMVCKPYTTNALEAVRVFAKTYRGAGPEPVPAMNADSGDTALPKPATPDEQARG